MRNSIRYEAGLRSFSFDRVICTSATAAAIVSAAQTIPRAKRDDADRQRAKTSELRKLFTEVSRLDLAERKKITGIGPRRAEIIVAGLAVFLGPGISKLSPCFIRPPVYVTVLSPILPREVWDGSAAVLPASIRLVEACAENTVSMSRARGKLRDYLLTFRWLQTVHGLPLETGRLLGSGRFSS